MEFIIKETGQIESIMVTDKSTGIDWSRDLVGNHYCPEITYDDNGFAVTDQKTFDWWESLTCDLQSAEDRKDAILFEMQGTEHQEALDMFQNISCDLEDLPGCINTLCDELENNN